MWIAELNLSATPAGWAWTPFSNTLEAGDSFKIIEGNPYSSLENNTWAEIKNMF